MLIITIMNWKDEIICRTIISENNEWFNTLKSLYLDDIPYKVK